MAVRPGVRIALAAALGLFLLECGQETFDLSPGALEEDPSAGTGGSEDGIGGASGGSEPGEAGQGGEPVVNPCAFGPCEPDPPLCPAGVVPCVPCTDESECGGLTPLCNGQFCVECVGDSEECPPGQLCDLVTGRCAQQCRAGESRCTFPDRLNCENSRSVCVQCADETHCPPPGFPRLDICSSGTCVECTRSEHCSFGSVPGLCIDYHCAECVTDQDCGFRPDAPRCSEEGRCVECAMDPDCAFRPDAPLCGDEGRCIQCRMDIDCPFLDAPFCNDEFCVECTMDEQCPSEDCDGGRCRR